MPNQYAFLFLTRKKAVTPTATATPITPHSTGHLIGWAGVLGAVASGGCGAGALGTVASGGCGAGALGALASGGGLTTGDGVVVTGATTLTESPTQVASISCASIFDSTPLDRLIGLLLLVDPITWKCNTARYPEPLTPGKPGTF